MKIQKITLSFSKYSDANLLEKAKLILVKMTGNPAFTNPVPSLAQLADDIDVYATALTEALKLGADNVAEKNKARKALIATLQELGRWVMFIANGDVTILIGSGFDLAKVPEPVTLGSPGNVTVTNGINSGTLVGKVPRVKGAKAFIHQITDVMPTSDTVWTSFTTSRSRYVFTNLIPGRQYWIRVAATGGNEQITYSPVSSKFSQ